MLILSSSSLSTFCIHITLTKLFPTKSSQSQPLQIDLLTNTHALFKCNNVGTCIEHFHFGCTPSYYTCQIISMPITLCPQFTCSNIMAMEINTLNLTWRI
jgi:hypothetical protein